MSVDSAAYTLIYEVCCCKLPPIAGLLVFLFVLPVIIGKLQTREYIQ